MNELADVSLAAPAPAAPAPLAEPAPAALPSPLDAVQAGQVPAITLSAFDEKDPLHEFVVSNFEELPKLGLDYTDLEGSEGLSAIFNPAKVSADQIQAAYKAGKLEEIAPLVGGAAEAAPAPAAEGAPAAVPAPTAAPLAAESIPGPAPARGLQDMRAANLQALNAPKVNTPTGGPAAASARRAF